MIGEVPWCLSVQTTVRREAELEAKGDLIGLSIARRCDGFSSNSHDTLAGFLAPVSGARNRRLFPASVSWP